MNFFDRVADWGVARRGRMLGTVPSAKGVVGDVHGGDDWRRFKDAEALFRAWGPPGDSPWSAYHRPTLFAALDSAKDARAENPTGFQLDAMPRERPAWVRNGTAIMLDLPAEASVAYAGMLARNGYDPVVTFNNWPHQKNVVDMWTPLFALLAWAPWVAEARSGRDHQAPPVFLLDSRRLGWRVPNPGEFDNRYYLLESDLPSAATFKRAGITRVLYVEPGRAGADAPGAGVENDDLNAYFVEIAKTLGVDVARADATTWGVGAPAEHRPAARKTLFSTTKDPAFRGFRRSAAGGFGEIVPETSGGGG